jgi:hypothetical protein
MRAGNTTLNGFVLKIMGIKEEIPLVLSSFSLFNPIQMVVRGIPHIQTQPSGCLKRDDPKSTPACRMKTQA